MDGLDAMPRVGQAIAAPGQNLPVARGVQVGKPFGELQLFAADINVAERGLLALDLVWQVVRVDRQEPPHPRPLVLQVAGRFELPAVVDHAALEVAKDEVQHVVEVHPNVRGHAERLARIAFPALEVPLAARGDVGEFDIKHTVHRRCGHLVTQLPDGVVVAQLKNVVDAMPGFGLDPGQFVHQFGRGDQRLLADDVAAQPQPRGDVRVVQVIGRAHRGVMQGRVRVAPQLVAALEEALELGEELALGRNAVDDADRVVDVVGHGEVMAGVLDRPHVAGSDVTGGADQGEVFHECRVHRRKTVKP